MLEENLRINEPGLNVLPPGVERYVINGGGLTGVQIFPDDEIEIIINQFIETVSPDSKQDFINMLETINWKASCFINEL